MIDTRKEDTQGHQIAWNFRVALCVEAFGPLSPLGPLRMFRFIEEQTREVEGVWNLDTLDVLSVCLCWCNNHGDIIGSFTAYELIC